tara:strand:- start:1215 stop:1829 length:615 start_codon:yes stop_codon:yes gene_type:complete
VAFISNGTTILDAGAFSASLGSLVLIKTLTASSSSTLTFEDGSSSVVLDNTYPLYLFKYFNIHPSSDGVGFQVGFRDGSSNYDATKTTTYFEARHNEADNAVGFGYEDGVDQTQSTGFQYVQRNMSGDSDHGTSGELYLFNPSSTTFVKHFISRSSGLHQSDYNLHTFMCGYCNVTAAIDAVQFKIDSGNIDSGVIKLYGIKDS